MPPTIIKQITNGNYQLTYDSDGTRIRSYDSSVVPVPTFPENMDLKVTNFCDNSSGCQKFCHEQSNENGVHGNLRLAAEILKKGGPPELAVGGGSTLSHPDILWFLREMKEHGTICNITVNQWHIAKQKHIIEQIVKEDLAKGIGISVTSRNLDDIKDALSYIPHVVLHLICGVHTVSECENIIDELPAGLRILLLGFKTKGNGGAFKQAREAVVDKKLYQWYTQLPKLFGKKNAIISFDNLGLDQLNVKRFLTDTQWKSFFNGHDGEHNFYMDAVKMEYASSSSSEIRHAIAASDRCDDMFHKIRSLKLNKESSK